jgi:hypothetical protein
VTSPEPPDDPGRRASHLSNDDSGERTPQGAIERRAALTEGSWRTLTASRRRRTTSQSAVSEPGWTERTVDTGSTAKLRSRSDAMGLQSSSGPHRKDLMTGEMAEHLRYGRRRRGDRQYRPSRPGADKAAVRPGDGASRPTAHAGDAGRVAARSAKTTMLSS